MFNEWVFQSQVRWKNLKSYVCCLAVRGGSTRPCISLRTITTTYPTSSLSAIAKPRHVDTYLSLLRRAKNLARRYHRERALRSLLEAPYILLSTSSYNQNIWSPSSQASLESEVFINSPANLNHGCLAQFCTASVSSNRVRVVNADEEAFYSKTFWNPDLTELRKPEKE